MLRHIIGAFFLTSCSLGTIEKGGNRVYTYDHEKEYSHEELKELSGELITTLRRDPPSGTLDQLFGTGQSPLKRVGIVIFETTIQSTRSGLAGEDKIYLSESGKQILTEKFADIWEEGMSLVAPNVEYVKLAKVKESRVAKNYGLDVADYINSHRTKLQWSDIFYLPKGKKTTSVTVVNPREMRDLSLVLVPATELMAGPKWSEQNKHYINDLMKELNLDAALIMMSEVSWSAARLDKRSGEHIPELIRVNISASELLSLSQYRERLQKLKFQNIPNVTLAYRTYKGSVNIPAKISDLEGTEDFSLIVSNVVDPLFKVYRDMVMMMIMNIDRDILATQN